jgi:aspartyl-tRNA(Asn)/glutamyl-tRNA(Gln) amidotransferase subunit C
MPAITRAEVEHLAKLARLALPAEELDHYAGQLGVILTSIDSISEVAVAEVVPTSHPLPLTNVMRADESRPSLDRAEVLAAAPATDQDRFRVPRILDEEA